MRRGFANLFKFAQIFILGGFFVFCIYGAWQAQAHALIGLLPIHGGNMALDAAWQYADCDQGSAGGNDYLILKRPSSTLISPPISLLGLTEAGIGFQARTYGGVIDNSALIVISISIDDGINWDQIATTTPLSSVLTSLPKIDLADYLGKNVQLKLETPTATGSKGVGLDEISIIGRSVNQPPLASIFATPTTAIIGEPVFFDGGDSTDTDGSIISYFWSFGDGNESILATTSHNYFSAGDFTAALIVTDDDGATSSDSILITIASGTPPATSTPTSTPAISTTTAIGGIVINEFQSNPLSGEKEWLELYNKTTSSIDLSGWMICDNSSTGTLSGIAGTSTDNYFIFEFSISRLNNDGDIIILKDSAGKIIDQIAYGNYDDNNQSDNAPAPGSGFSAARKTDGLDSGNDSNDFAETITLTKGSANIITPRQTSGGGYTQPPVSQPATTTTTTIDYPAIASGTKIIINEIFPNPAGADDETEFIELKNLGTIDINLAGWSLADATGKKYVLTDNALNTLIKAGGFLAIFRSSSKIALNNSGNESVSLYTPAGDIWEQTQYLGQDTENKSYSRDEDGQWFWTTSSTPGEENIFDQIEKTDASSTEEVLGIKITAAPPQDKIILISEIFPNPDSKNALKEFVELHNPNNEPLDLSGLNLSDNSGRVYAFKNKIIEAGGYLAIFQTESKISLNNDGDGLALKNDSGQIISQLSYQKAPVDYSLALSGNGSYRWTDIITPGYANQISAPPATEPATAKKQANDKNITILAPLANIRDYDIGQKIKTTGTVSAEPGILGANIFYLAGSGIQVYCYKKDFPDLKLGDVIEVTGELAESGGERRLKITDRSAINIISSGKPPMPHIVTAGDIGENYEGSLVAITGNIIEIKGRYLYLDDGLEEARIYLKESINNKDLNIQEGDRLTVTGIVSQTSGGYRLLPRYASDIVVEAVSSSTTSTVTEESAKNSFYYYLIAMVIFLLAVAGVVGVRYYKKRKSA